MAKENLPRLMTPISKKVNLLPLKTQELKILRMNLEVEQMGLHIKLITPLLDLQVQVAQLTMISTKN